MQALSGEELKSYQEGEVRVDSLEVTAVLSFKEYTGITIYETKGKTALDRGRSTWSHTGTVPHSGEYKDGVSGGAGGGKP